MTGLTIWFAVLGFVLTGIIFGLSAAATHGREHTISLASSIVLGAILLLSPLRGSVVNTLGDAAAVTATLLWGVIFLIFWAIGSAICYLALKKFFP